MATAGCLCFSGKMGGGIRGVKIGTQQQPNESTSPATAISLRCSPLFTVESSIYKQYCQLLLILAKIFKLPLSIRHWWGCF